MTSEEAVDLFKLVNNAQQYSWTTMMSQQTFQQGIKTGAETLMASIIIIIIIIILKSAP